MEVRRRAILLAVLVHGFENALDLVRMDGNAQRRARHVAFYNWCFGFPNAGKSDQSVVRG